MNAVSELTLAELFATARVKKEEGRRHRMAVPPFCSASRADNNEVSLNNSH